jgi:hypothetical protein
MFTLERRNIIGYRQESVPHTFYRQQEATSQIALVFAGRGVNCQHPTLYYPARELLSRGADVLLIDYSLRPAFSTYTEEETMACVAADTLAASQAMWKERAYEQVTLIGKSLGTMAMGSLLENIPPALRLQAIWLTPLLTHPQLGRQIRQRPPRSLFIIGTADSWYDADELAALAQVTRGESLVIPEADHSLEVPAGTVASLQVMEQVVRVIQDFLAHEP